MLKPKFNNVQKMIIVFSHFMKSCKSNQFSTFPKKNGDYFCSFLGPACFGTILLLLMLAFWMFHLIKHNKFFLYYAEGKDNHGVVEDHDAEVDTLCYKEIFKQRFHPQITFQNPF